MAECKLTSEQIYAAGYALPCYDILAAKRHWRYREEEFTTEWNAVPLREIDGVPFSVGRIEDVRRAHG